MKIKVVNQIFSLSGGKDSTAMVLEAIERGEEIEAIVFFDTGWEFPQMYDHIDKLEKYIGVKIWRLSPRFPFDYWLAYRPIVALKEGTKGQICRIGNGWPSPSRRWCTREKVEAINAFSKPYDNPVQCIGYAADEVNRNEPKVIRLKKIKYRFPLKEYGITEARALDICYNHGFDWGGLYKHFKRVSCFCCPLSGIETWRVLRREYPEIWKRVLKMDSSIQVNRGLDHNSTAHDLERRFLEEDSTIQLRLL